jgi:hypothetical protein
MDYTRNRDSSYMTRGEAESAERFLNTWNAQGASDSEIKSAVDGELQRRGDQ